MYYPGDPTPVGVSATLDRQESLPSLFRGKEESGAKSGGEGRRGSQAFLGEVTGMGPVLEPWGFQIMARPLPARLAL